MLNDKTILITGGTGSFGNAAIRKFVGADIKEIRIFSRDKRSRMTCELPIVIKS